MPSEQSESGAPMSPAPEGWRFAGRSVGAGYFWFFAAVGALGPFVALYYRELGFSGVEVGFLAALPSIALALSGSFWGAAADSLAAHRLVLRTAMGAALLMVLIATQLTTFPAMALLIAGYAIASAPIASFLDGYAVAISDRLGVSFGHMRAWGSVGYSLAVLTVGRLMGDHVDRTFFLAHALLLGLALLTTFGLPKLGERQARPMFGGLRLLARNRSLLALLFTSFLVTSASATINGFLGIRIEDIGGSASLIGVAISISAISEMPVIAFGSWFLRHLGPARLIALAIMIYTLRLLAYGVITDPEWMLPVQTLHGLSYGAFLIATVTLVHRLAGREHAVTAQGMLGAMSFGAGSIAGSLAGGVLLDVAGSDWLFRCAALFMLVTLVAYLVLLRVVGIGQVELAPAS